MCVICEKEETKYKCPRCEVRSCSSNCSREHKLRHGCSGIRERTAMVKKDEMNNLTLLNDYRFLEEIEHKIDDGYRHPLRYFINKKKDNNKPDLPIHLIRLKSEAAKRGTTIQYLPQHFAGRQHNSTRYIFSEKIIRWHVKLVFAQADVTLYEEKVDENTKLAELLRKYIVPREDQLPEGDAKLCFYQSASFRGVSALLKTDMKQSSYGFQEMLLSKSLKLNLANKKIIEYPVIYVVLNSHLDFYLDYEFKEEISRQEINVNDDVKCDQEINITSSSGYKVNAPRVKRKDGGLSFFNACSSDDDSD